jgi:hypothetical protein
LEKWILEEEFNDITGKIASLPKDFATTTMVISQFEKMMISD